MSDLPDLREQITDLFRDGSLYRESPAAIADAVLGVLPVAWDRFVRTIQVLRDQAERLIGEREEAWEEIRRLRREVEFEANGIDFNHHKVTVSAEATDLEVSTFHVPEQAVTEGPRGVRITHLPTGIQVESSSWRSQLRNKAAAIHELNQRLMTLHPEGGGS
jgi:hypothetical protein